MAEQSNVLDIVKTKLIQAKNGTTSEAGREAILNDVQKLLTQLDAIANQTNYNGINLLQSSSDASNVAGEKDTVEITGGVDTNDVLTWSDGTYSVDFEIGATATTAAAAAGLVAAINADTSDVGQRYTAEDNGDGTFTVTAKDLTDTFTSQISGVDSTGADNSNSANITGATAAVTADTAGGATSDSVTFQIGESSGNTVATTGMQANTTGLDLVELKHLGTHNFDATKAGEMMSKVDSAIDTLNSNRSNFGSVQNQLESAIRNMQTTYTNIKAAESTIRDVDYAQESANFNKQNIIAQAGTYALSQANAIQQNVLKLLQ
jgi:flagellin